MKFLNRHSVKYFDRCWQREPKNRAKQSISSRACYRRATRRNGPEKAKRSYKEHGLDKYKRTLADVLLPDGLNLKQGWGWLGNFTRSWPGPD
jgi:hypothetical protein